MRKSRDLLAASIQRREAEVLTETTVLCVKPGWGNIGHWLTEMLPIADLAQQLLSRDLEYLVDLSQPSIEDVIIYSLMKVGINHNKIHKYAKLPVFVPELIVVKGLTHHGSYMSPLVLETLAKVGAGVEPSVSKKIYVSRSQPNYRTFVNETEVCEELKRKDFDIFKSDEYSFEKSIGVFSGAEIVLGTANAALVRICFCRPGTQIVVFYPSTLPDTFFWFISQLKGLVYTEVRCEQVGESKTHTQWDTYLAVPFDDLARLPGYAGSNLDNASSSELRTSGETMSAEAELIEIAKSTGTDKHGLGIHWYGRHYAHHFEEFRTRKFNLLEIGIGGYQDPQVGGASLRMWKAFFPKALIVGLDVFEKSSLSEDRIKIYQGSQDDSALIQRIFEECGGFDIIIDDGSHINSHVISTFRVAFPLLNSDGIYAIEDLQTSYWRSQGGSSIDLNNISTSMGFLKSLVDGLNFMEFEGPTSEPDYFARNIVGLHFYHNIAFIRKGANNEPSNVVVGGVLPPGLA